MNNKETIKSILEEAMQKELPSEKVELWPAVQAHLVAGKPSIPQQGVRMNMNYRTKLATAGLILVLLLSIGCITPQGRAMAKGLLQLFTRAEGRALPLLPGGQAVPAGEPVPTAVPPSPLVGVEQAESQVGFQVARFTSLPYGLELLGARLYGTTVSLEYGIRGDEGSLLLLQSRQGFMESDWDRVPEAEINMVSVGGQPAEFVQGTFVALPGQSQASWNSSAPVLRLRWMKDGTWYELTSFGNSSLLAELDQDSLIALTEQLDYPDP